MPDFRSIYDAYRQAETPLSLKEFSRLGNYLSGDDSFAPADLNGFQETVKKGSYWFDKALEATGAPQASADLFGSVFKSLGGSEEAGREVGASLPRTAVEWAPAIAGGPVGIGSRLGLAIAGAAGAAGAYEKTDSGASAATAGAMPFVGSALGSTAASALAKAAGWTPEMLAGSASKRIVQYIASQAGALGGMEAINAVESGQAPDYTSKDYWLKLAASQLPFAVFDAKRVLAKPELPVPPVEPPKAPGEPTPTEVPISPESAKVEIAAPTIDSPEAKLEAKEKISISRKEALAEAEAIDNPVDKQKAIEGINKSHDELAQAIDLGTKPKEEVTKVEEEKKSKANYTSWDSEAAANRFAESIKGKYDVNVIPDEATGKFNVEYSKKAEVEKLPTMPEVDPNAAPEQAVKVLTEVDKKEEVNKQIVELVAKGETPARAVEIATNKVLGEATEVPVETPAKAKNKGGRPSTTKEVEALFTRLMSDTPGTPRDAEFAKAMKDHKVAEVVQDNSKAQTNSQANKGYRVLRNAYDAWTNGVDWGGIKMDGKPASEVMSAIKSRIKAEMKRTITAGSKPYVEHVTGEDPVGEAKEALAEESKVALETEDEEEAPVAVKEDNSPDDLQEGDKDNLARSKGDSLDPDQVAAEQSDAIGSALSFGHRLEAEGLLDDQATRIAWANHVFAMKAKAKTPEAKKLVETRLEALAKLLKVERKDIGPALRDYWFKQNEEWEARGNSGAILRPAGGGFEYALDEYDPVKNRLGKHTLPKDGWITEGQLKVMGQKQRLMKDHEIELYKVIVPEAFKDGKVNVPVLDKGLQNNLATEVHTYGQEGSNETKFKVDQARHELETKGITVDNDYGELALTKNGESVEFEELSPQEQDWVKTVSSSLFEEVRNSEGPRATQYYNTISPFDTKKYPVQRIDVVVPISKENYNAFLRRIGGPPTNKKLERWSEENKALWQQDDLHENLPNTLGWAMVQFVPDARTGETVAFVGEQQSRWGQQLHKGIKEAKGYYPEATTTQELRDLAGTRMVPKEHPLLETQANLVLKAVIREAQKRGVSKIVISDGASAMMTEQHDKGLSPSFEIHNESTGDALSSYQNRTAAEKRLVELKERSPDMNYVIKNIPAKPSQEGGMRLHYDTTLPSIMKQLTGERGEMWDGGVHKNAIGENTPIYPYDANNPSSMFIRVEPGQTEAQALKEAVRVAEEDFGHKTTEQDFMVKDGYVYAKRLITEGSPVFRNPDGTPKTNATGRIYDITNAKELARFNRGGRSPLAGLETKLEGVAATFDSLFYRVARKSGLHDKETAAILPSFKKMLEVAGMKDVEYGELISDSLVGGKDIKGMATTMGEKTRRMWLAALGGKDKVDWSRSMMALIAHENGHLVDQLYNTNQLMGARAKQAYEKMLKWKDTASPEELKATMKQAAEMLLPEKWQQLPELKEMLDVADGTEALATLHGIFSLSEGVKRFDAEIGSALLPAGPRGFLRTLAEYGSSFVKLLKNMLHIGGKPDKVKLFESLQENYKELQHGVKQASENLYNLQKLMSYNPADMSQVKLSTLEALQTAENPDSVKQMARFLAVEPKDKEDSQLLNAPVGMIHQAARGMSYLLEPLDSLTARFPVFADVGSAIMQTPATAKRLLGDFLSPMYGERDKITGDITAGSKEQQKMQKLWHEDVAVNEAINKIEFWQQKNREIWDPAIGTQREPVAELLRNMTPEKRNAVLAKVAKTRIAVGVQHQAILDAFKEKNKYELAERLAARKPQLHEKSLEIADLVSTWADYSAKGETALAAQMQMEAAKLMPDPIALAKLQEHAKAMQTQRDALKQFYVDRPWFHSYSRIGEWAVDAWDKNNKQVKHAVPAKSNAEAIALEKQFRSEGLKTNIKKISRGRFVKFDEEFQSMLQNIDDTLRRSAQDYFNGELPPDKIDEFFSENSFSGTLKHFAEVQSKFKPTEDGRTLRGAEDLDVMRMELEQAGLLANSLAKTISGSKLAWAKRNPKLTTPDMAHVMKQYESAWGNYHVPDNVTVSKITKGISVYSLALNMANHMAELVQPGTTILSQATAEHGAMNSVKTLMGVLKDVAGYYTKRLGNKLSLSDEFVEWGHSGEKNMLNTLADEGRLHNGSFTDGLDPRDQGLVSLKIRARGAGQGYVGSAVQNVADSTMRLYASFNRHNARIAGLLGYRLGAASGMDHIQATDYAKRFVERAALTNTRALRPVGLFGEDTRALGQLATVMQRYNMGWLSMAARHIQRGWLLSDAQAASRGFDAESKGKARNAALMLLGSQLLAAGAVGLPFAGAMTKAYEALTGDDIKADTYQMFDKMMGEDSQSSGFFADSLIRGFANSTLSAAGIPVDMSSRFAIGGLPGMSEVSGFDAGSAFGPVGGMIKTIATGAEALAKDRDIVRAGKVLMPTGLRRLFDLAMNGDMTDNNMNRMGLSGSEKMLYGLGFTPDRIRKLRDFENMQENVTSGRRLQTDRIESQIASLMQTDPAAAQQMLHDKAKSLEISSKDLASGVAKQVEKKTLAKDFRSAIPSLDAKASMSLMRGLGTDFGEPSETKKAQLRANVMSSLGVAPDIRDMIRARRADEMLSQISRQPLAMTRQKRPSFLW